jgi:hypothetical protein
VAIDELRSAVDGYVRIVRAVLGEHAT